MRPKDDLATLPALGAIAYMLETLIHEMLGHGGVCLAQGRRLEVVTPLWMHCDVVSPLMVAGGPVANGIAAVLSWAALRTGLARALKAPLFIWLCFTFNGLVAAGYLGVGGATAFGDWAYLFGRAPAWLWRPAMVGIAAAAYWALLRVAVDAYARFGGDRVSDFVRRAVLPAAGACAVALAAEIYGQGVAPAGFVLPIACTLVVGASLAGMRDLLPNATSVSDFNVSPSPSALVLSVTLAGFYVLVLGPGLRLGGRP